MATGDVNRLREVLDEIIDLHPDDIELIYLVEQARALTYRDRVKAVTARATAKGEYGMTDEEIKAVIRFSLRHPNMSNRDVGRRFGCDGGRVSEYCGTKRNERLDRLRKEVQDELRSDQD